MPSVWFHSNELEGNGWPLVLNDRTESGRPLTWDAVVQDGSGKTMSLSLAIAEHLFATRSAVCEERTRRLCQWSDQLIEDLLQTSPSGGMGFVCSRRVGRISEDSMYIHSPPFPPFCAGIVEERNLGSSGDL